MVSHEIVGDDMQAVIITLGAGDEVRAEAGAMTFMTEGIEMDARMTGGLVGGLKRAFLAGESLVLTSHTGRSCTGLARRIHAVEAARATPARRRRADVGRALACDGS
jgi:uncharacterized protein (AIM24 family)